MVLCRVTQLSKKEERRGFWSPIASTGRNGGAPARHSRAASEDTEASSERATRLLLLALPPASHWLLLHMADQLSTNAGTAMLFLAPELTVPALAEVLLSYRISCQRTLQLLTFAWIQNQQDKFVEKDATEAVKCRHHPSCQLPKKHLHGWWEHTLRKYYWSDFFFPGHPLESLWKLKNNVRCFSIVK